MVTNLFDNLLRSEDDKIQREIDKVSPAVMARYRAMFNHLQPERLRPADRQVLSYFDKPDGLKRFEQDVMDIAMSHGQTGELIGALRKTDHILHRAESLAQAREDYAADAAQREALNTDVRVALDDYLKKAHRFGFEDAQYLLGTGVGAFGAEAKDPNTDAGRAQISELHKAAEKVAAAREKIAPEIAKLDAGKDDPAWYSAFKTAESCGIDKQSVAAMAKKRNQLFNRAVLAWEQEKERRPYIAWQIARQQAQPKSSVYDAKGQEGWRVETRNLAQAILANGRSMYQINKNPMVVDKLRADAGQDNVHDFKPQSPKLGG